MIRFVIALILLGAVPAHAGLTVCNKAGIAAKAALGSYNGRLWTSHGWWTIPPQKCETLIKEPLNARYYYLYATDGGSGTWNGDTHFCTASAEQFSIAGRGNCAARGYDRKGFFVIDTGNSPNWKQTLSD